MLAVDLGSPDFTLEVAKKCMDKGTYCILATLTVKRIYAHFAAT